MKREKLTGVYHCVLGLIVTAVGPVCIVVAVIAALSSCVVLHVFDVVSETHVD